MEILFQNLNSLYIVLEKNWEEKGISEESQRSFLKVLLKVKINLATGEVEGEAKTAQGILLKIVIFCIFWETNAAQQFTCLTFLIIIPAYRNYKEL